jgi:hypothetical protein
MSSERVGQTNWETGIMKSKAIIALVATTVVITFATWEAAESQSPSRPPGVSEENWIPISDSVGILVTDVRARPGQIRVVPADPADPSNEPTIAEVRATPFGTGVVMAMFQGEWVAFEELAISRTRVYPLK